MITDIERKIDKANNSLSDLIDSFIDRIKELEQQLDDKTNEIESKLEQISDLKEQLNAAANA